MEKLNRRPGFGREVVGTFATRVLVLMLGLVGTVVLARVLGPDGRGAVTAVLLYPTLLLTFFEGGFRQATIHALGQSIADERDVVGAVLVHFVLAAFLSALAVVGLLTFGSGQTWSFWQLAAAAAFVPTGLASALVRGLLLGKQEILVANLILRRAKYAYTILLLALWAFGLLDITMTVVITVLGQIAGVGIGIRKLAAIGLAGPRWSLGTWWVLAKRGAIYAAALFAITTNYRIGMVVMERAQAFTSLGEFTIATQLAEVLWQLPSAFGFVLFAHAASAKGETAKRVERTVAQSTRLSIAIVALGALVLGVASPWVVPLVFGAEFAQTPAMIMGLLPGIVAFTTYKVINMYFAGIGQPRTALLLMVPTLIVNFVLASLFVGTMGGIGIAYAASISYIVAAVLFVAAFQRKTGIGWSEVLLARPKDIQVLAQRVAKRLGR